MRHGRGRRSVSQVTAKSWVEVGAGSTQLCGSASCGGGDALLDLELETALDTACEENSRCTRRAYHLSHVVSIYSYSRLVTGLAGLQRISVGEIKMSDLAALVVDVSSVLQSRRTFSAFEPD